MCTWAVGGYDCYVECVYVFVACVWQCGVCARHVECNNGILTGAGSVWYIWMWAQTKLMFALGCVCAFAC